MTDNECPICYVKYGEQEDGNFICKDGKCNSLFSTECTHYICVPCARTLYNNLRITMKGIEEDEDEENEAVVRCPLCRENWTEWLLNSTEYAEGGIFEEEDELDYVTLIENSIYILNYKQPYHKGRHSKTTDKDWKLITEARFSDLNSIGLYPILLSRMLERYEQIIKDLQETN